MNHQEKLFSLLDKAAKGVNHSQIFDDFLKLTATSLACMDKSNLDVWQNREQLFQETIRRYDTDTQKLFVDMFAELGLAINECAPYYFDVLGGIFQKLNLHDRYQGQVFTPEHICKLMGNLAINEELIRDEIRKKGYVTIVEPCCGSGAITLGALNEFLKIGVNPLNQCLVVAYDLDERCISMTFIQLSLYKIPAVVMNKNAITDKMYGAVWKTI